VVSGFLFGVKGEGLALHLQGIGSATFKTPDKWAYGRA